MLQCVRWGGLVYASVSEMLNDENNSVVKIQMWLAVQYWEMFYSDADTGHKDTRVTFNEVDEVRVVQTENQLYLETQESQGKHKQKRK